VKQHLPLLICLFSLNYLSDPYVLQQSEATKARSSQNSARSINEIAKMPVLYRLPGMDRVIVKSDLKYTPVNEPHLLMDVYIPARLRRNERRPAVVFIHGSVPPGSPAKNMQVFKSWGRLAGASGMVGVTFTHRLGFPIPSLSEAASDVTEAINYIRMNAERLNVDKDKICLVVFSGGGPMLSMAMRDRPTYVRGLVSFYAFLDIQESELHKAHETPEKLKSFSPITYLENAANLPPIFVARAGRDAIAGLNSSIDRFTGAAMSKNIAITVVNHPEGVHAFDIQTDDDRTREIIRGAIAFMRLHLGQLY
jgi:acetyl esterase/lipase